jgi:hypothetical protein
VSQDQLLELYKVGRRNQDRMFGKFGKQLFRNGRRFAKSTAVRDDIDDEPRLAIEGIPIVFGEPILNKLGEIIGTFRSLVERVVIHPRKPGEEYKVSIRGYLASLMGVEMSAVPMVAGEGLEPPTPGL